MADPDPAVVPTSRIASMRNAFFSGLVLIAPICLTVWIFWKIIDFVGGAFKPLFLIIVPLRWQDLPGLDVVWSMVVTLIVLLLVTVLGYASRYVFGKYFLSIGDRFVQSIPGVSAVYSTVRQIVNTFSSKNRNMFNKVVLVEFPRKGCWTIGFLTNTTQGEAQTKAGTEVWTVFVPTTPNPTGGFLLMLPRTEIVELELPVGDGMKMIISGGAMVPTWPSPAAVREAIAS